MAIDLIPHALCLPFLNDFSTLLSLEEQPLMTDFQETYTPCPQYLDLIDTIKSFYATHAIQPDKTPIFWLLPDLTGNEQVMMTLMQTLTKSFPGQSLHSLTRLYPYGDVSFQMAWSTAQELLLADNQSEIWLVAVDYISQRKDTAIQQVTGVGLASMILKPSDTGLYQRDFIAEATLDPQQFNPFQSFFERFSQQINLSVDTMFVPVLQEGNANGAFVPWLDAFASLGEHASPFIKFAQPQYRFGDVGCLSAFCTILLIKQCLEQKKNPCSAIQVGQTKRYQAASLFEWKA